MQNLQETFQQRHAFPIYGSYANMLKWIDCWALEPDPGVRLQERSLRLIHDFRIKKKPVLSNALYCCLYNLLPRARTIP